MTTAGAYMRLGGSEGMVKLLEGHERALAALMVGLGEYESGRSGGAPALAVGDLLRRVNEAIGHLEALRDGR